MSKISEFFGLNCKDESLDFEAAMNTQICPYTQRVCTKMRKSDPDIKIGTCSVQYQHQDVIICPYRLLEHNQIFIDCLHLLTMHEPGNELYLVPEVQIPGGHVDYFLASAKDKKVKDFIGIELQTMDTTGTVWPERQKFLNEKGISVDAEDLSSKKSFGMNWKMTLKTILIQMHHKSETFENLNKHLVLSKIGQPEKNENDHIDNCLLYEVYLGRVDILITEDRRLRNKADHLGLSNCVFSINGFIAKVSAENPDLIEYKALSVEKVYFGNVDSTDSFFDSFRNSYTEFDRSLGFCLLRYQA